MLPRWFINHQVNNDCSIWKRRCSRTARSAPTPQKYYLKWIEFQLCHNKQMLQSVHQENSRLSSCQSHKRARSSSRWHYFMPGLLVWLNCHGVQKVLKKTKQFRGCWPVIAECYFYCSTGQKQLLCLARLLLRPAKIVVLDEATSSVDAKTAAVIEQTLIHACAKRTVLVVAHRLSTILNCSRWDYQAMFHTEPLIYSASLWNKMTLSVDDFVSLLCKKSLK